MALPVGTKVSYLVTLHFAPNTMHGVVLPTQGRDFPEGWSLVEVDDLFRPGKHITVLLRDEILSMEA